MAYSIEIKHKAIDLRKHGYSVKEVSDIIGITKSTSSLWLRDVTLGQKAQRRLQERRIYGQYKTSLIWKQKRKLIEDEALKQAHEFLSHLTLNKETSRLICSLLYWAEGAKTGKAIKFMNSDPQMIKTFISHFRNAFDLKESKFRCLVHIHEYHDDLEIKKYWSGITSIPLSQFNRSYLKPHTGKRKKDNYRGCLSLVYSDVIIFRQLRALYNIISTQS